MESKLYSHITSGKLMQVHEIDRRGYLSPLQVLRFEVDHICDRPSCISASAALVLASIEPCRPCGSAAFKDRGMATSHWTLSRSTKKILSSTRTRLVGGTPSCCSEARRREGGSSVKHVDTRSARGSQPTRHSASSALHLSVQHGQTPSYLKRSKCSLVHETKPHHSRCCVTLNGTRCLPHPLRISRCRT